MAKSKVVITIPSLVAGDYISFFENKNGELKEHKINCVGGSPNQYLMYINGVLFDPTNIIEESLQPFTVPNYDAVEYVKKFEYLDTLDYYTLSRVGNVVTIQSNIDNLTFESETSNNVGVLFSITNENAIPVFSISDVSFVSGDCSEVTTEVTTSSQASKMTSPILLEGIATNPFSFTYLRGQKIKITTEDSNGQLASQVISLPSKALESDIEVNVISTQLGSSATIVYDPFFAIGTLTLTYSINGIDYFSNNVFEDLSDGDYTAYIKDQFGCITQKAFTVVNTNVKTPYNYISKTNSIRFAKRENWDGINIHKTDENTLSSEVTDDVPYEEVQYFQTNDIRPTQIRSNYDTVKAFVIDGATETQSTVTKIREYLNLKDYRDCVIYRIDEGRAGIYFTEGDAYNYDSGIKIGDYQLNGALPVWYKVGTEINLEGVGVLEISRKFYDEVKGAEIVEVAYNYTGNPTLSKVKSIYNLREFNLFEVNTDFSTYQDKFIQVRVEMTDAQLPTVNWISERISVKDIHKNCAEIKYSNDRNGDIFYETGIKHLIRVPYKKISDAPISESEIHKGDNKVNLTKAEYYEGYEIQFKPLTKEYSKIVEMSLLHSNLEINGVDSKIVDAPDKAQLDDSNLYDLKAKLIKSNGSFNTNVIIEVEENISEDLPNLISNGEGFILF